LLKQGGQLAGVKLQRYRRTGVADHRAGNEATGGLEERYLPATLQIKMTANDAQRRLIFGLRRARVGARR
jgi:hypothetical protein